MVADSFKSAGEPEPEHYGMHVQWSVRPWHCRYVTLRMVEVAMPRELFAAVLDRVQRFGVPAPLVQRG